MAITTFYCTWDDVVGRLSAEGAERRVDDDPSRKVDVMRRATAEVNKYLLTHYTATALAASEVVKEVTADIAWFFASGRRNNPPSAVAREAFERAVKYLEDVHAGDFILPDTAARKGSAPTLSNQRALQYPVNRVATVTGTSTGRPEGYLQHNDNLDWVDYSI
jgi:phage gp36-like protein